LSLTLSLSTSFFTSSQIRDFKIIFFDVQSSVLVALKTQLHIGFSAFFGIFSSIAETVFHSSGVKPEKIAFRAFGSP
jgi:hypothetical protein